MLGPLTTANDLFFRYVCLSSPGCTDRGSTFGHPRREPAIDISGSPEDPRGRRGRVSTPSRRSRTMLITGATGFIGSRLATRAQEQGYLVKTFTRSDWAGKPEVHREDRYFGSLPDEIPPEAFRGVDVVVHCAADVRSEERSAWAVNVDGTNRLARMASSAGARTFVFLSSQSARPTAPSSYGRTKSAAEQELLKISNIQVVILRPGLVTGPGGRGLFAKMCRLVESLPVIPILGDAESTVQPIHVDDLCEGIIRCDRWAAELQGRILSVGAVQPVLLRDFLQEVALTRLGRRKPTWRIPLGPIEKAVRIAERIGLSLPVTSNNLKGLRGVENMDTERDLSRLGLSLRPLREMVSDDSRSANHQPREKDAVRVLLVGGGRVGLVHAITLSRTRGVVLAGVVDPKPAANSFLRGLGISVPAYRSLDEALTAGKADAAIIATPVSTHLPLTRLCLAGGLAVMVEKPLALAREQLGEYESLAAAYPDQPIHAGYVMVRNPQVFTLLDDLRSGRLGRVRGFCGFSLVSLIQRPSSGRWETVPSISGGGAYINGGAHVLSMIRAAFGDPVRVDAQAVRLHSPDVEDSIVATFEHPEFTGIHYCSWSIRGFPRQENSLVVWTDLGKLTLTGSVGVFERADGEISIRHQLDFDVGFNIAADYAGAGFTTEIADLVAACRTRQRGPMDVHEAVRIEQLLFDIYDASAQVKRFTPAATPLAPVASSSDERPPRLEFRSGSTGSPSPRRLLDLREVPLESVRRNISRLLSEATWSEVLLFPLQVRALPDLRRNNRLRATVPDFLNQSRLLSMGRVGDVLKEMQVGGVLAAARSGASLLPSERGPTFWVAAMGLLGAALHAVGSGFRGTILVHNYLTDFALSLRRFDMLAAMLAKCRRSCPAAKVGFHTNMASEMVDALRRVVAPIDHVSVLASPEAVGMLQWVRQLRDVARGSGIEVTVEVGLAPAIVHRAAFENAEGWGFGADAVLIGAAAEPTLAADRRNQLEHDWAEAFPGLTAPDSIP